MILFLVVRESIRIFLCKDRLKSLYIWRKDQGLILDIVLIKGFEKILEESVSYTYYNLSVMGHLDTNNFYFILFYFSDFTFIFFYFLLKDNEEGT